ncbi:uncharacterized protein LOC108601561 [Drosophila busckii]|uniref:uncharacterized protein LOC108601561 n=1 Tax=Drosophila busckii TaxID=30019 RepID=UPI00083F2BD7|nr:uncharacterized protein LOC108601561 [Drosophila busckii]
MWQEQTELHEIYCLTAAKQNWRKLIAFGDTLQLELKRKLLWIWPTTANVLKFNQALSELQIQNILSIGCGSGLLEWLMLAAAENRFNIYGLERDANWWCSKQLAYNYRPTTELGHTHGSQSTSSAAAD